MKKMYLLCIALFMCGTVAFAQDDDVNHAYEFVTNTGELIPNGSQHYGPVVTMEEDPETGEMIPKISADFTVKNVAGEDNTPVRVAFIITRIDNGSFVTCAMGSCLPGRTEVCEFNSAYGTISQGGTAGDMQTEWYPDDYGECVVDMQIEIGQRNENNVVQVVDWGPMITAYFQYKKIDDGVENLQRGDALHIAARHTMDGQTVSRPVKGINILRMADGSVRKVLVR